MSEYVKKYKLLKDILYVHYYYKNIMNRMFVIGFLRGLFKFRLFIYITWKNNKNIA